GEIGGESKLVVPALLDSLRVKEAGVRQAAAVSLGKIGPRAEGAVPALVEGLRQSRENWDDFALALSRIGRKGVAALTVALSDRNASVRQAVARALCIPGKGPYAFPGDPDVYPLDFEPQAIVPHLRQALKDNDCKVRWRAAETLGSFGP